jgi:endonuclease/exonuclease/phosphatase family metal-dependent hydrolase
LPRLIKILQQNILADTYNPEITNFPARIERISDYLESFDADIILLQEATKSLIQLLCEKEWFKKYKWIELPPTDHGTTILSKCTPIHVQHFKLSENKFASLALFNMIDTDHIIQMGCVHLHSDSRNDMMMKRINEMTSFMDQIDSSIPTIIGGDINTKGDFPINNMTSRTMSENKFVDCWTEINRSDCVEVNRSDCVEVNRSDCTEVNRSDCVEVNRSDCVEVNRSDCVEVNRSDCVEVNRSDCTYDTYSNKYAQQMARIFGNGQTMARLDRVYRNDFFRTKSIEIVGKTEMISDHYGLLYDVEFIDHPENMENPDQFTCTSDYSQSNTSRDLDSNSLDSKKSDSNESDSNSSDSNYEYLVDYTALVIIPSYEACKKIQEMRNDNKKPYICLIPFFDESQFKDKMPIVRKIVSQFKTDRIKMRWVNGLEFSENGINLIKSLHNSLTNELSIMGSALDINLLNDNVEYVEFDLERVYLISKKNRQFFEVIDCVELNGCKKHNCDSVNGLKQIADKFLDQMIRRFPSTKWELCGSFLWNTVDIQSDIDCVVFTKSVEDIEDDIRYDIFKYLSTCGEYLSVNLLQKDHKYSIKCFNLDYVQIDIHFDEIDMIRFPQKVFELVGKQKDLYIKSIRWLKNWTKKHHIYHQTMGYLDGCVWYCMACWIFLNHHIESVDHFIEIFSKVFSEWNWNEPVSLTDKITKISKKNPSDHMMRINSPIYPYDNMVRKMTNYTKNVILTEILSMYEPIKLDYKYVGELILRCENLMTLEEDMIMFNKRISEILFSLKYKDGVRPMDRMIYETNSLKWCIYSNHMIRDQLEPIREWKFGSDVELIFKSPLQ